MKNTFLIFFGLIILIDSSEGITQINETPLSHKCEESVWQVNDVTNPSESSIPALTSRFCLRKGSVIMDEFRALNDVGEVSFRGVSFIKTNNEHKTSRTLWVMIEDDGITHFTSQTSAGKEIGFGGGYDAGGAFLERSTTSYLKNGNYNFVMSRSFDSGQTWMIPFNVLEYRKVKGGKPQNSNNYITDIADAIASLKLDNRSWEPILDGFAALAFSSNQYSETVLHFASIYKKNPNDNTSEWRSVSWNLVTGFYQTERHILKNK